MMELKVYLRENNYNFGLTNEELGEAIQLYSSKLIEEFINQGLIR